MASSGESLVGTNHAGASRWSHETLRSAVSTARAHSPPSASQMSPSASSLMVSPRRASYDSSPPRVTNASAADRDQYDAVFHLDSVASPTTAAAAVTYGSPPKVPEQQHHIYLAPSAATNSAHGGRSEPSDVVLARNNVELYNALVKKEADLRQAQGEIARLRDQLGEYDRHIDRVIDMRVREAKDLAAAEFELAAHAANAEQQHRWETMKRELMLEAGRVEAARRHVESLLASSGHGRNTTGSPPHQTTNGNEGFLLQGSTSALGGFLSMMKPRPRLGCALVVVLWLMVNSVLVLIVAAFALRSNSSGEQLSSDV